MLKLLLALCIYVYEPYGVLRMEFSEISTFARVFKGSRFLNGIKSLAIIFCAHDNVFFFMCNEFCSSIICALLLHMRRAVL